MVSFSVIVPTCGRPSLAATLASLQGQLERGDEVLCIADGTQPEAERIWHRAGLPRRYRETAPTADWGASQRNQGLDLARGSHLLFMDDDDVYTPGALAVMRRAVEADPETPHIFRMRFATAAWGLPAGAVIWHTPDLAA